MSRNSLKSSILAVFFTLSVLLSASQSAFAADSTAAPTDVIGTIYKDAVTNLMDLKIIAGFETAGVIMYKPDDNLTRAQLAKIVVVMLGFESQVASRAGNTIFRDVPKDWATGYINVAYENNLVNGIGNGLFSPKSNVTYEQAVTILLRALGYGPALEGKKWPEAYLAKADEIGLIGDVKWSSSKAYAQRGNIALLIWNTLNCIYVPAGKTLLEEKYPDYVSAHRQIKTIPEIAQMNTSIVLINKYNSNKQLVGAGSGFIVSSNGLVVTNYHVIDKAAYIEVITSDKTVYSVKGVTNYSVEQDLAVLKLDSTSSLPAVILGDSDKAAVGEGVVAIGSPLGLQNTVSSGIISSIREEAFRSTPGVKDIQISAPISSGSSGGALFNMYGEVIGVTYAGIEGEDFNFAIPVNEVKPMLTATSTKTFSQIFKEVYPAMTYTEFENYLYENHIFTMVGDYLIWFNNAYVQNDEKDPNKLFIYLNLYEDTYNDYKKLISEDPSAKAKIQDWMLSISREASSMYPGKTVVVNMYWYLGPFSSYPGSYDIIPYVIEFDQTDNEYRVFKDLLYLYTDDPQNPRFEWYDNY